MASSFSANSDQFLSSLDAEIQRLQQIRTQVADALGISTTPAKSLGRPRKQSDPTDGPKVRKMSEEGRRRIAEAQKARWAKQKKTAKKQASKPATVPVATKKAPAKATASKNASKKTAAKAVPAKKVAAKKAPIKKSAAPAPVRKSAPAKKVPAKKTAVTTPVAAEPSTEA